MKNLKYLLVGVLFGITLSKAEVISWFRIYEMFKLQSFHMFGVIGTAVVLGFFIMRGFNSKVLKSATGAKIRVEEKKKGTPEKSDRWNYLWSWLGSGRRLSRTHIYSCWQRSCFYPGCTFRSLTGSTALSHTQIQTAPLCFSFSQ